jgi:hypothetical protein
LLYKTPVVRGGAPVNWFKMPGKESDGADTRAFVYSKPVAMSCVIVHVRWLCDIIANIATTETVDAEDTCS